MKKFVFASLLLIALPVYASHIVGGEFEMIHVSGYTYQFNLILYFDDLHGDPGALDNSVIVTFFSKRNDQTMMSVTLPLLTRTPVAYSQPACSSTRLKTDRLYYSATIYFDPARFNDPSGYYASWQRCCRNYQITNIYSESGGGLQAGQTFYIEFPPVIKDGVPFVNSTPHLFPPLSDYGCPGRPYYVNFAGTDDDGDSIAYSMTTPLNTKSATPTPPASPAPYPGVLWRPGYSLTNIMYGAPDLRISTDGLLTCTPTMQGLFVFAVKAEEFRNGVKIGETRRDFQMLVTDGCQPDQPPVITGKKLTDATFSYVDNMSLTFSGTVANSDRCIIVRVSDADSQDPLQNNTENISIRVVALNFKGKPIESILPSVTQATLRNGETKEFTICFPECPFINAPYQIGIIAQDDACSLPMTDTLRITVNQQPPPNAFAYFLPQKKISDQLHEGESKSWPFTAKDSDGDNLVVSLITDGFILKDAGMVFKITNQQAGSVDGTLNWDALCKNYEFSKKKDFTVKILVDDLDKCKVVHYDTVVFNLKVVLPNINPRLKIFDESSALDVSSSNININLGHLGLNVIGTDTDTTPIDTLNLSLLSFEGNVQAEGYTFNKATGVHYVASNFSWDTDCTIFKDTTYSNNYTLKFLVTNNHCKTPITDTAFVKLALKDKKSTDKDFLPANVVTTYPDHCNDFFAIDGFEGEPDCNGQMRLIPHVPIDNCSNRFERVRIYDRWGKQVFESSERKFRWYAATESAGVYYYVIDFTKGQYKSPITVIH